MCWNCKQAQPIQYNEDPKNTLRCPRCGELEKDKPAPAGKTPAARKAATRVTKEAS